MRGRWLDILFEGNADWEARFASTRTEGEPFTLKEAAEAIPIDELKRSALRTLVAVISGRNSVQAISKMRWAVFPVGNAELQFMTSDAPVIRTNGIGRPEGFLAMPISPHAVFVSAQRQTTLDRFTGLAARQLAAKVNEQVVGSAFKYVYAADESQSRFVTNRFGRTPLRRLVNEICPE